MSPYRRARALVLTALLIVILILYVTSDSRRARNQTFYQQTVEALDRQAARAHGQTHDDGVFQKLKPGSLKPEDKQAVAVDRQKYDSSLGSQKEDPSAGKVPVEEGEKSIAGRKKVPTTNEKKEPEKEGSKEDAEVEAEFNSILKRSPIIIFSKTYCPYSRKAKYILLTKYKVVPSPFVVELDEHSLGPQLQKLLGGETGRSTVPNVLINGKSIGGGDEVEALDISKELAPKIKALGGKRVMEVKRNDDKPI